MTIQALCNRCKSKPIKATKTCIYLCEVCYEKVCKKMDSDMAKYKKDMGLKNG